jgi:hypothetical protein
MQQPITPATVQALGASIASNLVGTHSAPQPRMIEGFAIKAPTIKSFSAPRLSVDPKISAPIKDIKSGIEFKADGLTRLDGTTVKLDGTTVRSDGIQITRDGKIYTKDGVEIKDPAKAAEVKDAEAKEKANDGTSYAKKVAGLAGALAVAAGYNYSNDGRSGKIVEIKDQDGKVYVKFEDGFTACTFDSMSIENTTTTPNIDGEYDIDSVISDTEIVLDRSSADITDFGTPTADTTYTYHTTLMDSAKCSGQQTTSALNKAAFGLADFLGLNPVDVKKYMMYVVYIIVAIVAYKVYKMVA